MSTIRDNATLNEESKALEKIIMYKNVPMAKMALEFAEMQESRLINYLPERDLYYFSDGELYSSEAIEVSINEFKKED